MKKIKLSLEKIEEIKEEAVEKYKGIQRGDFKFVLLVIIGLVFYVYLYEKVGNFGMIAIFVVALLLSFIVAILWGRFKR